MPYVLVLIFQFLDFNSAMNNKAPKEKMIYLKILPGESFPFVRWRICTSVTAVFLSFLAGWLSRYNFSLVPQSKAAPLEHVKSSSGKEYKNNAKSTTNGFYSDFMETLVHPAMLAHQNPKRILIIGGAREDVKMQALLTEVFRHKIVEKVTVVATMLKNIQHTDRNFIGIKKPSKCQRIDYLDSLEDLRMLLQKKPSYHECYCEYQSSFDVVVLLHPFDLLTDIQTSQIKENVEYNVHLSSKASSTIEVLSQNLIMSPEGILVTHLGPSPYLYRKSNMRSQQVEEDNFYYTKHLQLQMINRITSSGEFEDIHVYEDASNPGSCWSRTPQSYAIFCKDESCRNQWYADESYFNYKIHTRLSSPPKYVDGAMLERFSRPPKAWESLYCSFHENRRECQYANGFDPDVPNIPLESFEVKMSSLGKNAGRGLFTKVDIPEGCYIMLEKSVQLLRFSDKSLETVLKTKDIMRHFFQDPNETENSEICLFGNPRGLHKMEARIDSVLTYLEGYGYDDDTVSSGGNSIDSGLSTFVNHGCNKTFNYGPLFYLFDHKAGLEESEYDYAMISEEEDDPEKPVDISKDWDYLFDPLYDRHLEHMQSSYEGSIVNVSKGQEIFCNYVLFSSDESKNYIQRLRAECRGEVVGTVVKVEGEQS